MKDTTSKNITLTNNPFNSMQLDSVHKDLKGIRCEIAHYRKEQKMEKQSVSDDTVFTVVVTISVFVIGIIIDRLLKWYERTRKEEDLRNFFEYHLKRSNKNMITLLKKAYHDFSENTTIDTGLTSTPPKVLSSDFQRLINTNFEELFKAYETKEILSKVLSNIELADKVQTGVNEFHEMVYQDSGKIRDELEKITDEYLSLLSKYTLNERATNVDHETSDTYKLLNDSLKTYYTEIAGTRELTKFYGIVRTIQEKIVQTGEYQTNPILTDVAEKGRKLSYIVSKLKQKTKEVTDQYKTFSGYMNDANTSITTLIKQLK